MMSELTEYLRKNMFLVPMENGGELISNAPSTAADKIDELQAKVEALTKSRNYWKIGSQARTSRLQAKVEALTGAIKKWLDGDYPNPRRNRPRDCMHGVGYWQSCENCETEYWESVLKQEASDE